MVWALTNEDGGVVRKDVYTPEQMRLLLMEGLDREGYTQKFIGTVFGISQSEVCKIFQRAQEERRRAEERRNLICAP